MLPVHPQSYTEASKRRKLLEELRASEDKGNIDSEGTVENSDAIS